MKVPQPHNSEMRPHWSETCEMTGPVIQYSVYLLLCWLRNTPTLPTFYHIFILLTVPKPLGLLFETGSGIPFAAVNFRQRLYDIQQAYPFSILYICRDNVDNNREYLGSHGGPARVQVDSFFGLRRSLHASASRQRN